MSMGTTIQPFYSVLPGPPSSGVPSNYYVDLFNNQTVAGTKTWQAKAVASSRETIAQFTVSDDTTGKLVITNASASDNTFVPWIQAVSPGSNVGLWISGEITTDTGGSAAINLDGRVAGAGAISTRPLVTIINNGAAAVASWAANGALTSTITAQTGVAEILQTMSVSDDATGQVIWLNGTSTDGIFNPLLRARSAGTGIGLQIQPRSITDTGTNPVFVINPSINGTSAIVTRPIMDLQNNSTSMMQLIPSNSGAGAIQLFTPQNNLASPSFTNRSIGTRVVFYPDIDSSHADLAIGCETGGIWQSVVQATSSTQFNWYGGTTKIMSLRGDGLLTTTGGYVGKTRVALTSPVTVAVTDWQVSSNLTVVGAVTFNLPSSPTTGTEFYVVDDKGDAATNNLTIVPAAGTINGAANYVVSTNYGGARLVYNGTEWRAHKLTA